MTEGIEGGCRCGAIRYRVTINLQPPAYACHCLDCQTWSGSAFSMQFIAPEAALEVRGEPQIFALTTPSGRVSRQRACGTCFTRIYNTNSARPGFVVIRAGTLDRSDQVDLVAHIWAKRKLANVIIPPGIPVWPEAPPPEDFLAALALR
jgi:hypothetical protein